ncbi:hypothetical protein PSCLAVI8L_10081 [Pseudoclavibacter sp. 8L]|nr:hypothetical protein PSCLAVI8L_10081 [Pseudoclavibacter sp. 8L]
MACALPRPTARPIRGNAEVSREASDVTSKLDGTRVTHLAVGRRQVYGAARPIAFRALVSFPGC